MDAYMNPRTMGILGLAQGLLQSSSASPRQITMGEALGNGLQGGMNGYQQGTMLELQNQHLQQQKAQAEMQQQKMLRDMESRQLLQSTIDQQAKLGKTDPRSIGNALISTGHPELITQGLSFLKASPKAKSAVKVMQNGQPVYRPMMDSGEFGAPSDMPAAEKLMQINQGSQVGLANPYTGQIQSAVGVGMSPGQAAQLAQSDRQFQQSQGLAQQRLQLDKRNMVQPKMVDGAWVYPPTAENPQGTMIPTDMYTPPKGSVAAQKSSAGKVNNLLDEAEKYIGGATGSAVGNLADMATGALGVSLPGAQNIARLKTLEAGLVMGMPRLEGPQSNLDQQLYREAAGQIGNPNVPPQTKKAAIETIRKIQNSYPGAFGGGGGKPVATSNDGWGELR